MISNYIIELKHLFLTISYWIQILTIPLGIFLNLFSIYIYSRPNLNKSKSKTGFFYMNLCFWSINASIINMFIVGSSSLFGYDFSLINSLSCAFIMYFRRVVRAIPCWIDCLITLDRYLLICHNHKFKLMTKKRYLSLILAFIIIGLMIINQSNFHYQLYISFDNTTFNYTLNVTKCETTRSNEFISDMISCLFRSVLPSLIMITLSWFLIRKVYEKRLNIKKLGHHQIIHSVTLDLDTHKMTSGGGQHHDLLSTNPKLNLNRHHHISKETSFTLCIISMNLLFFFLNMPFSMTSIYLSVFHNILTIDDPSTESILQDFYILTFDLTNLYYSLMFFSYLLFNKLFYKEVLIFLGQLKCLIFGVSLKNMK